MHRFLVILGYAMLLIVLLLLNSAEAGERTQLDGCHFCVRFPSTPKLETLAMPGAASDFSVQRSSLIHAGGLFRHECLCYPYMILATPPERYLHGCIAAYANSNGLNLGEIRSVSFADARGLETRFYKEIGGTPTIYLVRTLMTFECHVEIVVAGAARMFPGAGMLEFLNSAERVQDPNIKPADWIPLRQSLAAGKRFIDLANLKSHGTIVEYRRRYITSQGQTTLFMVDQIDCATARARVIVTESWSSDGELKGRTDAPNAGFEPFPNDPIENSIHNALCENRRPHIDGAVVRLKRLGN